MKLNAGDTPAASYWPPVDLDPRWVCSSAACPWQFACAPDERGHGFGPSQDLDVCVHDVAYDFRHCTCD